MGANIVNVLHIYKIINGGKDHALHIQFHAKLQDMAFYPTTRVATEDFMQTRLTKRIPVEEKTWAHLSRLKEPGETYDDLLNRLMENEAGMRLSRELRNLEAEEDFVEFS